MYACILDKSTEVMLLYPFARTLQYNQYTTQ